MHNGVAFDQHSQENAVCFELYQQGATTKELEQLQLQCMAAVLPHLTGYIWQQDAFTLHTNKAATPPWKKTSVTTARSGDSSSAPEHLWGLARFGDNIEDEWLIVWLLHQITIKFSSVRARIWDNDGDFLLIEAAYSLPKWLKPETSKNRILSSESVSTVAKAGMQEAIRLKIKGYPRKAQADMHRARCLLPAKIAHVLQHKPQMVSPAVQTFHYRDVQDMQAAAKLAHFQPQDLVTVIVSFNRALYAQLAQQQFQPPRGYPLPAPNNPAFKAANLGMKLTCGFEMVMAKHTSESSSGASCTFQGSAQLDASALKGNPQWAAYKASLAKNGYFRDNIPGSVQYKELLAEAVQAFGQSQAYQQSVNASAGPGEAIAAMLQQPIESDQFEDGPEDDDTWMTGGKADLEAELAQRQQELEGDVAKHARRAAQGLDPTKSAPEFDPSEMVSKLNAFVNQTSGHEGAEVPSDMDPDVSFNDPAFWRELKSALGVAADKHGFDVDQLSDSGSSSDGFGEEEEDNDDNVSSSSEEVADDMSHSDDGVSQPPHAKADRVAQPCTQTSLTQGKPFVPQLQHPAAADSQQHIVAAPASDTVHDAEAAANDDLDDSASDVMTATDSDDEDAGFMHAYDEALADELSGSRVGSIITPAASAGAADQPDHTAAAAAATTSSDQAEDLQPLDLDTNLVRNLLQSYTAQQGLAGPAGNLAGLLGFNLPDHAEAD
ncbi:hypothetical protein WJX77_009624 [Trebouxia sp. C0004]